VEDHVSVDDPPAAMLAGDVARETVGRLATVTSALDDAAPPTPVQVRI
jgi:hypothetical protein